MLKSERHEQLIDLCAQRGAVSVAQAAKLFGISEMTARRDFDELAHSGDVLREHGGIRLPDTPPTSGELPFFEKLSVHQAEKERIAQTACSLIAERDTIFLGPGSTCAFVARSLPPIRLRVVTSSILVLNMLQARDDIEICALGGQYRKRSGSFVGPVTEAALAPLGIDKCFISTNGVLDNTISCSNLEEGRIQALACNRAGERYLLCDASKLGLMDFFGFYGLDRIDAIVTDESVTDAQRDELGRTTRLVIAKH